MTQYQILRAFAILLRRLASALARAVDAADNKADASAKAARGAATLAVWAANNKDFEKVTRLRDIIADLREREAEALDQALDNRDDREVKLAAIYEEVL